MLEQKNFSGVVILVVVVTVGISIAVAAGSSWSSISAPHGTENAPLLVTAHLNKTDGQSCVATLLPASNTPAVVAGSQIHIQVTVRGSEAAKFCFSFGLESGVRCIALSDRQKVIVEPAVRHGWIKLQATVSIESATCQAQQHLYMVVPNEPFHGWVVL